MKSKIVRILATCLLFASALTSCGGGTEPEPTPGDKNWVDYAHNGAVKLNLDYEGRDFYKDGIGLVTLKTCIDGDTAHFYPVVRTTSNEPIKARYYGIDTPESTGRVQEYGKPASNFNKQKLKNAAQNGTIVLSSAQDHYGEPQSDSTGDRYVSLIWINETKKNASYTELTLLNLEIVQNGYSWVKNVQDMPSYSDTFYAAETQAKKYKLNLFSGRPDPEFNYGEYVNCSLLDLKVATENYLKDRDYHSDWDGAKVRIRGTVAGFADGTLYIQSYFTEEDSTAIRGEGQGKKGGEYASINVFCGMSDVPARFRTDNTFLEMCVLAQYSENFGFQLTGAEGHFPVSDKYTKDDDVKVLLKADENTDAQKLYRFEYTAAELDKVTKDKTFECINCAVEVTEALECSRAICTKSNEITLAFKDLSFEAYLTFNFAGDPSDQFAYWTKPEQYVGKLFMVKGVYAYHQTASTVYYQINVCSKDNIYVVEK